MDVQVAGEAARDGDGCRTDQEDLHRPVEADEDRFAVRGRWHRTESRRVDEEVVQDRVLAGRCGEEEAASGEARKGRLRDGSGEAGRDGGVEGVPPERQRSVPADGPPGRDA
jgi:hypothetical protein